MLRREDPRLLTGEAKFTDDLDIPGALHLAVLRSPYAHARITGVDLSGALGRARRRRRLHRRRPPGRVGHPDAVRLGGHRGHEEPAALPRGRRAGEPRRRRRRGRAGPHRDRGPRRPRGDRGRLRPAARSRRPRRGARRQRARASRPRHQQGLHVGADHRGRGRRAGIRRRGVHGQGALRPAAPHPDGHGTPRLRRRAAAVRRRPHPVLGHPDPPHPQGHGRRSPSASPSTRSGVVAPVGRRRLRLQARRVRGGAALRRAGREAPGAGALGRGADRERAGHHPGPRPDPGHRAGRRRRRPTHRGARRAHRRHGQLPAAGHAGHPAARRLPLRRGLRRARGLLVPLHRRVHHHDADRRLPRCRTPRGDLRHRAGHGPARGRSAASIPSSCAGATSSAPSSSPTRP